MVKATSRLADVVLAARVAKFWTQEDLARESKVSPGLIADIERGRLKTVRPLTAAKIGAALEINLKAFTCK